MFIVVVDHGAQLPAHGPHVEEDVSRRHVGEDDEEEFVGKGFEGCHVAETGWSSPEVPRECRVEVMRR